MPVTKTKKLMIATALGMFAGFASPHVDVLARLGHRRSAEVVPEQPNVERPVDTDHAGVRERTISEEDVNARCDTECPHCFEERTLIKPCRNCETRICQDCHDKYAASCVADGKSSTCSVCRDEDTPDVTNTGNNVVDDAEFEFALQAALAYSADVDQPRRGSWAKRFLGGVRRIGSLSGRRRRTVRASNGMVPVALHGQGGGDADWNAAAAAAPVTAGEAMTPQRDETDEEMARRLQAEANAMAAYWAANGNQWAEEPEHEEAE